jgi:hypothetical protein
MLLTTVSFLRGCIPLIQSLLLSRFIQYHALTHPTKTPIMRNISVQEYGLGHLVSIQIPRAMPITVGMATDHPTRPNMPRPNQTPRSFSRRALILRSSLAPTFSISLSKALSFYLIASDPDAMLHALSHSYLKGIFSHAPESPESDAQNRLRS